MKNRWLKRRDADQQSAVIRNLTEHNKQLWDSLTAAQQRIEVLEATIANQRALLNARAAR